MPDAEPRSFAQFAAAAAAHGLDACAWLPAAGVPAAASILPGADTIVVLGHGARSLWGQVVARHGVPRAARDRHPLDAHATSIAHELLTAFALDGVVHGVNRRPRLDFVTLAEQAGLGYRSPVLGLLLHRVHGPWLGLRAALLLRGQPFGAWQAPADDGFAPCVGCARPCVQACPVAVYTGDGTAEFARCWAHRQVSACARGCAVRRACPVGAAVQPDAAEEAFRHAYSTFALGDWVSS